MNRYTIIFLLLCLCLSSISYAQVRTNSSRVVEAHIENGDTLPYILLPDFYYFEPYYYKRSKKEIKRWNKLKRNVVKVYPYAKITSELLEYYAEELEKIEDEDKRKDFMIASEEALKEEFRGEVMNMTISQGKVLVKLIDRETGQTSYELIKDLRSGFTAFMWNSVAILFGNNLKAQYDPQEDADIELIVQMIERGEIDVIMRDAATAKARADLDKKKRKELRKKNRKEQRDLKKSI